MFSGRGLCVGLITRPEESYWPPFTFELFTHVLLYYFKCVLLLHDAVSCSNYTASSDQLVGVEEWWNDIERLNRR